MDKSNIGYKLFRVKAGRPGEIFPLYVNADKPTPFNEWIPAEYGELKENGKVKSKLGDLAFRPGWHITSDCPFVNHIYSKGSNGERFMKNNLIWCEVEYSDTINYQNAANKNGINKSGKFIPKNACLKDIPINGYYRYKTNPNMYGEWIIAGAIKVTRILSDKEVSEMCRGYNLKPLKRKEVFDFEKYGFKVA